MKTVPVPGKWIRPKALDFATGDVLLRAGTLMEPRHVGLAAAMNIPWVSVVRRPRVGVLSTGDEVVFPGESMGPYTISSSNTLALCALVERLGGEAINLGVSADSRDSLAISFAGARGLDLLITTGGVSVGEHDFVRSVIDQEGGTIGFWRVAMRPGKPLMLATLNGVPLLGLPGNPVSTLVCGMIFVAPALQVMQGRAITSASGGDAKAKLGCSLPANDQRQDYLRARLEESDDALIATPFERQDSSMMALMADADCLVVRPPHVPAAVEGDMVRIIRL